MCSFSLIFIILGQAGEGLLCMRRVLSTVDTVVLMYRRMLLIYESGRQNTTNSVRQFF